MRRAVGAAAPTWRLHLATSETAFHPARKSGLSADARQAGEVRRVARRPVIIDVEVDGQQYQEMHVDGGAMAQVFLYRPGLNLREEAKARDAMTRSAAGNTLSGCV